MTIAIPRRIDPRNNSVVLTPKSIDIPQSWELVQTEEEKLAQDRARDAFKADQRWFDNTIHFALCQEVQMNRGAL
jgi:hypothetical protein